MFVKDFQGSFFWPNNQTFVLWPYKGERNKVMWTDEGLNLQMDPLEGLITHL